MKLVAVSQLLVHVSINSRNKDVMNKSLFTVLQSVNIYDIVYSMFVLRINNDPD